MKEKKCVWKTRGHPEDDFNLVSIIQTQISFQENESWDSSSLSSLLCGPN